MRIAPVLSLVLAMASSASAATVTLDFNGFPNLVAGQVGGPGLEAPIPLPAKAAKVEMVGLQAGGVYSVDFFHNSGENSSDFSFTINDAGTGVSEVSLGGGKHKMVTGFQRDATVLKLATFDVNFNSNSGQTGDYYIQGAVGAGSIGQSSKPQTIKVIPGYYAVDNLYNTNGGEEDFAFIVDDHGKLSAVGIGDEFVTFDGNKVKPRAAQVHFKITASAPINYHPSHPTTEAVVKDNVYEFDMDLPVGGGGINVWSFGENTVAKSNLTLAETTKEDGTKVVNKHEGVKSANDFLFFPRLRYDAQLKTFYFQTPDPLVHAETATAEATGTFDGGETALTVKVEAKVVKAAASQ